MSSTAAISPDGSLVAYNRVRDDWTSEIHIIGVNSPEPKVLYGGPAAAHILDWSRDGSALLVREVRAAAHQPLRWLLISARTGEVRELNLPAGRFGTDLFTEAEQLQVQAGLSPDARFVAYTQLNERSEPSVYVAPVDGSSRRRVTVPGASAYVFAWSPNGKSLLYISDQSGSHDLWALDIKDGSPVGLPTLVKKDIGPVFGTGIADDGSVFYSVKVNTGSVYLGELDVEAATVNDMRELPQPRGTRNASAKWSPDGSKLLLLRRETADRTFQNVIYDVVTGQEHEIAIPDNLVPNKDTTGGAERSYQIDWTPDPRTMLFASARLKGPTQISIVDTVTGEVKRRTNASDAAAAYYAVTPSPDGVHVFAVTGRNMSNDSRVVRINMETGQENSVCRARPMVWAVSPDGRYVACGGYSDSLQVVAADGGRARDLVKGGMFSAMAWTPDGKNLIYTTVERGALTSAKYWIVPFGGGEPRRLTVPLDRLGMLSIDPSGRRIAITAAGRWTELWVLQNLNTSRSRPTP
jgi:Tol biopolymer transport system component